MLTEKSFEKCYTSTNVETECYLFHVLTLDLQNSFFFLVILCFVFFFNKNNKMALLRALGMLGSNGTTGKKFH